MIPIDRPSIRRKDMDSVLTCMVDDNLGPGSRNGELVSAVSHHLGVAGGIALRERSRALGIAIDLLGLPAGARVALDPLVPAYYHDVIVNAGLIPAYVDVTADGICIDAVRLRETVDEFAPPDANSSNPADSEGATDGTARAGVAGAPDAGGSGAVGAIITHTTLGHVPDMESIAELGIPIIEDISEGIGANTGNRLAGAYGRLVVVGMEPDGIITAGGGTLLLASAAADVAALRRAADDLPPDSLLPDLNAALGLTQVKELERFIQRRAELAAIFARAVMRGRHAMPGQPGDAENVHHSFPVVLASSTAEVRHYARKKGVDTAMAFGATVLSRLAGSHPVGGEAEAERDVAMADGDFPVARGLGLRCVRFPLYPALTSSEVTTIERVLSTLP